MSDHGHWRVLLAVPADDVEALRLALPRALPREHWGLATEALPDGSDGDSLLWIDVLADSEADALAGATNAYAKVREVAQLPLVGGELLGLWPPSFVLLPWHRLQKEAERLHEEQRHELAVVRAQTSLEVYAGAALGQLCRDRFGEVGARVAKHCRRSLRDARTIDLLEALVGERLTDQDWWTAYVAHVKRRNAILHEGVTVTAAQAAASLQAVSDCRTWLLGHWSIV